MKHRLRLPVVAVAAVMLLGALRATHARAARRSTARRPQAAQLEAEIQANGDQIAALGEQYNGAVLAYQNSKAGGRRSEAELAKAAVAAGKAELASSPHGAPSSTRARRTRPRCIPNTDMKSMNELGVRTKYGAVATGNDEQLISNLVASKQDLAIQRKALDKQISRSRRQARLRSPRPASRSRRPTRGRKSCSRK